MHKVITYLLKNQLIAALAIIALGWFIFLLKDIIISLFLAFILMAALRPLVAFFMSWKFPRGLAIATSYIVTLLIIVLIIFPLVPFFLSQVESLLNKFPSYIDAAAELFNLKIDKGRVYSFISSEFEAIGRNAFFVTSKVFSGIFSILTIFVISFYLMVEHSTVARSAMDMFPPSLHEKVKRTLHQIEDKLGAWFRGQIILSLFIGVLSWIGLTILGLEFALPLAVIAGLLEIIPTLGPILAAIPAVIVAASVSPTMVVVVIGMYTIIQVVENNILVPKIMAKAVGLNPLVVLISVIIGGELMGIFGALLSVPFISLVIILISSIKKAHQSS